MNTKPLRTPCLFFSLILAFSFAAAPSQLAAAAKLGKPAKVTWSPSHLTETDFAGGVATLSFTADQNVAAVTIEATPSLTPYLTVEPSGIDGVVAGTAYEVTVTLNDPDNPPEQTLGGTIRVKEGPRTLARPLSVSIQTGAAEEEEEEDEEGEDDPEDEELEDDEAEEDINTLTWVPELIDETLFAEGEQTTVLFTSTKDIEKVCLWLTPSVREFLTVEPSMISPVLADGTEYELTLTLSMPAVDLPREVGGTLHVRHCDDAGQMTRTYDPPIGIEIIPPDAEETPEADPEIVVSSADFQMGAISPNQIISVFGNGLANGAAELTAAKDTKVETIAGGTQVLVGGLAAPVLFSGSGQVNAIVPAGVAGRSNVALRVTRDGKVSAPFTLSVADSSPALYALDGSGSGPGAILNSDLTVNSRTNRAARGSWIVLYGTGGGLGETESEDGAILTESIPLSLPVEVTINGVKCEVLWAGYPAGSVVGLVQVNVMLANDARLVFGEWPVVLKVGDNASGNTTTVAIK